MTGVLIRRGRLGRAETQRRRPREARGRDGREAATGQGRWSPQELEEAGGTLH